ncbi:MAG TPA: CRISPR-associated helicase Cas3' [Urbifossiella sp.]|jgi:CRISPR-associated endonuclease/helicase Cas3|nr:CRISPR-associated helicase Cas3' [Urbifossiella sp.]
MVELLAKSGQNPPTVAQHCRDVREAGDVVWAMVAADLAELLPGLPAGLAQCAAAAQLLHDLLKANSAYQDMLAAPKTALQQPVRHEVLAAAFLTGDGPLAAWFTDLIPDEATRWAVVWAVAGHHFKMLNPYKNPDPPVYRDKNAARAVTLHMSHPQVRDVLAQVGSLFGTPSPPTLTDLTFVTHEDDLRDRIDDYVGAAMDAWDALAAVPGVKPLVAVLKALATASDAAGSAIPEKTEMKSTEWVRATLGRRLTATKLEPIVLHDLGGALENARSFQLKVAASKRPVTIVAAGCGNGKTTAAYMWAQRWADGKKLFFTYPTTGTATAGFINYLHDRKELYRDLIHSRSEVDLAAIRANPKSRDEKEQRDELLEAEARIDSLRAWAADVVTCTVDTILGLMQCQRRGMYSFPAFVAGAFVFDEIHAYDEKLWSGLLRFLKEFPGVPALLMSASIPPGRRQQLEDLLGDRTGEMISGDVNLEKRERYRLERRDSVVACWKDVERALSEGKKVLWVCNTVGDVIDVVGLARKAGHTPIVYHSRFRYRDRAGDARRRGRQREVVDAFEYRDGKRVRPGASLVIATQVCEMSLDISADLMVTAECPLPALVQRLGRLNRYATSDDPWPCLVYPFCGLPYNEDPKGIDLYGDCRASMEATRKAVSELADQPCSQKDLAGRLAELEDTEAPDTYAALFDDGWVTKPMPVRDGDASVTVIWESDLPEIARVLGADRKKWSAGKLAPWTIPMNLRRGLKPFSWERAGPYPIAPADILIYSVEEGARWVVGSPQ